MTVLARWRKFKELEERGPIARRPNNVKDCHVLSDGEKFRREIISEVSKNINLIQNPGLGEGKLRDLNDEINRLLKIKEAWEWRIKELGGVDYRRVGNKELESGAGLASNRGYKYFGAAKDLPGVRELFQKDGAADKKRTNNRADLMKNVDANYYGFLDDDDGVLIPLELMAEVEAKQRIEAEWREKGLMMTKNLSYFKGIFGNIEDSQAPDEDLDEEVIGGVDNLMDGLVIKRVVVPTQAEMENILIENRRRQLIEKHFGNKDEGSTATADS
uniref:Pre-mRNA-splicing factor ISY1 n=1 Tax=Rhabditophanes sp. KR3021 TaxID=114890 RepID=A0AC35UDX4_9BILA